MKQTYLTDIQIEKLVKYISFSELVYQEDY